MVERHVVVVGGGIAGLAAAARLAGVDGPEDGPRWDSRPRVTLLEASARVGGKLLAGELEDVRTDFGAESMLARRPEAVAFARAVGLGDQLQPPATAKAAIWTRGALRPMPTGHVMGVPGDLAALAATGVVSEEGMARIEQDLTAERTVVGEDATVGGFVAARVGQEVVDRLVEPLLGGVYAGHAGEISLRAAVPQLLPVAQRERSLVEGVRGLLARGAAAAPAGPVFQGIRGGIGRLPLAAADACRAAGVELLTRTQVTELRRTPDGWRIISTGPQGETVLEADAVVLAAPAPAAARLLEREAPAAAAELSAVEYASMALVTLAFRRTELDPPPPGSGFLVPAVDGRNIKASTFSSNKWSWVAESAPDSFVLRTSFGRHREEADLDREDAELVTRSLADLREAAGITAAPYASTVTRWRGGLPQYPLGHLDRVARAREQAAKLPGLALCGAAYDGVGIPACIGSGQRAADSLLATLSY
jgi:oxygen-dependent protoporphyrinogen oxidase